LAARKLQMRILPHAQQFDELPFEIDHIIPITHGGRTAVSNLALSCFPCNRFKGPNLAGIDPSTGRLTKLFHPRRHSWLRHFIWENATLVGRTAIGRTTIGVLKINELVRARLRAELLAEGAIRLEPSR
jgi:hypothetical protein